jgi:hypothetical protein
MPNKRRDPLATVFNVQMTGRKRRESATVGGKTNMAVDSAFHKAILLGASSPNVMCKIVMRAYASVADTVWRATDRQPVGRSETRGSMTAVRVGVPIHPRARLAIVMPSCVAAT